MNQPGACTCHHRTQEHSTTPAHIQSTCTRCSPTHLCSPKVHIYKQAQMLIYSCMAHMAHIKTRSHMCPRHVIWIAHSYMCLSIHTCAHKHGIIMHIALPTHTPKHSIWVHTYTPTHPAESGSARLHRQDTAHATDIHTLHRLF